MFSKMNVFKLVRDTVPIIIEKNEGSVKKDLNACKNKFDALFCPYMKTKQTRELTTHLYIFPDIYLNIVKNSK